MPHLHVRLCTKSAVEEYKNAGQNSPFLPHLRADLIEQAYRDAPGNEIASGKILSLQSSAALVANTFGWFLDRPETLPPLPGTEAVGWPARYVWLERSIRFPWSGGRHPWSDVLIATDTHIFCVESKRYEPFRTPKKKQYSPAFSRDVWGDGMKPYEAIRDAQKEGRGEYRHLDTVQLVKHAFGLRTESHRHVPPKPTTLIYLYAEPATWPDGRAVDAKDIQEHREDVVRFSLAVVGAEVAFNYLTYAQLLQNWLNSADPALMAHASAIHGHFGPL